MSTVISEPRTENGHVVVDLTVSGCLFDMDGTLMMSTPCVVAAWTAFAEQNGVTPNSILDHSHGRRTIEILHDVNPKFADQAHVIAFETTIAKEYGDLATPVPGVTELVNSIPAGKWGVVTSATKVIADEWLKRLNLNPAGVVLTAENVTAGKPDPQGYLLGKKTLNLGDDFLVFEDAFAGVKAGLQAGAVVVGMATTYDAKTVKEFGANIVIPDMTHIKLSSYDATTNKMIFTVTDPYM